ncbi:MAG: tyrosine-type recombinase/integrase [Deferrisomatales bacterium]
MYYVMFWQERDGRRVKVEEKVGRQYADGMTAAKASKYRADRLEGRKKSRKELRAEQEAAKAADADRWTVARLWAQYKEDHPNLKGLVTDENRFKNYLEADFGGRLPAELVPLDVDRLRIKLTKAGKAAATVRNVLELLRRVVNFGVRKHLCDPMPFRIGSKKAGAAVELPVVNNERTEELGPEELARFLKALDAADDPQVANLMRLALLTGMRRGELFKLTWEDVNFETGFITLRDPKGKKDQKIPLSDGARVVLESHPRPHPKSAYVFPGRKGRQRVDITKQVNKIKEAAGLPKDFRALHGLRHAFASMLASSGAVDLYTLQKLLTHKSPTMTQRYAHLRDDTLRKASALAGTLVAEATAQESPAASQEKAG